MSPKVLWDVVRAAAARAGIDKPAPHDLRRTCARLCHLAGGELDQINAAAFTQHKCGPPFVHRASDARRSEERVRDGHTDQADLYAIGDGAPDPSVGGD